MIPLSIGMALGTIIQMGAWRLRLQSDARQLGTEERKELKNTVNQLAEQFGITKQVHLLEVKGLMCGAQAQGVNFGPFKIGIALNPRLITEDPDAVPFIMAHELSHIRSNDVIIIPALTILCGLVAVIAVVILIPSVASIAGIVIPFGMLLIFFVISRWREKCADVKACSVLSDEDIQAAIQGFEKRRGELLDAKHSDDSSFLEKLFISSEGEDLLDVMHPSLQERIDCLSTELRARSESGAGRVAVV